MQDASAKDVLFTYDQQHIELLNQEKPWSQDHKYFKNVKISGLASMKMLKHAMSGVEQGRRENGISFEVMGLIVGKPDGDSIVVLDAYPLPVKGAENSVVADSAEVQEYMVQLSDALEKARPERFVGWYHSHPFDVDGTSHCFLSATDVSTQFAWQNQLDPWVALVIDPLRSMTRQEPDIQAFRCYPVSYNPPNRQCPDGSNADDEVKQARWGKVANRYYQLHTSYFMSTTGANLLTILARNHLWMRVLANSSIMEPENRARMPDRMEAIASALQSSQSHFATSGSSGGGQGLFGASRLAEIASASLNSPPSASASTSAASAASSSISSSDAQVAALVAAASSSTSSSTNTPIGKALQAAKDLAREQSQGHEVLSIKDELFNQKLN